MKENKLLRYMLALSMMLVMGMFVISCGSKNVNPPPPTITEDGQAGGDTPFEVNGSGYVTYDVSTDASLSLDVREEALDEATLSYVDHGEDLTLESISITDISIDGNIATIKGTGDLFGNLGTGVHDFIATITDGSPDYSSDAMGMMIFSAPSSTS